MVSLKHSRPRPPLNTGPIFVTIVIASLMTFGGWPGWFNNDSRGMQLEAIQGDISDWHSPVLTWFWSFLLPSNEQLVLPYLLQILVFWTGVFLIVIFATRPMGWWAALIPALTLGADHLWEINWLSKDAVALSLVVFSLGLFASSLRITQVSIRFAIVGVALFVLASISIARWYLLPACCVLMFAYLWTFPHQRGRVLYGRLGLLAIFLIGSFWPIFAEGLVVRPSKSFHSSSTQLLDLWRASCLTNEARASDSKFPKKLIVRRSEPICTSFSPFIWNEVNEEWQGQDSTITSVRLPKNETEEDAIRSAWFQTIRTDWPTLLYSRVMTATQLLRPAEYWTVTGSLEPVETSNARLTIARIPSEVLASGGVVTNLLRNGALYVLVLPMVVGIVVWRRARLQVPWIFIALAFPITWVANMALVAPAIDTRYVAPAIGASIYLAFIALSVTSPKMQNTRRAGGI